MLILFSFYTDWGSEPARETTKNHGAETSRFSSPAWRTHHQRIVSSILASLSIHDENGKKEIDILMKLVSKMQLWIRTCVSQNIASKCPRPSKVGRGAEERERESESE